MVGMAGFEPATSCSQISSAQSPDVAPRRPAWCSPGVMVAGRRPASPDDCARWLPLWLPLSRRRGTCSCLLNRTSDFASEIKVLKFRRRSRWRSLMFSTSPCSYDTSRADFEGGLAPIVRERRSGDQPCSAISSPVRVCWRGGISHATPRDRVGQADERAAAGVTSVRGPAAAWRSGVSYLAAGCIRCGRD